MSEQVEPTLAEADKYDGDQLRRDDLAARVRFSFRPGTSTEIIPITGRIYVRSLYLVTYRAERDTGCVIFRKDNPM